MPDITKCAGTGCPLKTMCYRYTSTPHEHNQSWFSHVPYVVLAPMGNGGGCDYYIPERVQTTAERKEVEG